MSAASAAVFTLIRKDWTLHRLAIGVYSAAAAMGALLAASPDRTIRSLGVTLVLNVMIGQFFHFPMGAILGERERRTLAFGACLMLFMVPLGAVAACVALTPAVPVTVLHLLPAALLGWLLLFAAVSATTLVSESLGVTMAVLLGLMFVLGNGVALIAPRIPALGRWVEVLSRGGSALSVTLGAEALAVAGVLALAVWLQGRKQSYV